MKTITEIKKEIKIIQDKKNKLVQTNRSTRSRYDNQVKALKLEIKNIQIAKPVKFDNNIPVNKKGVLTKKYKKELKDKNIPESSPRAKRIYNRLKKEIIESSPESKKIEELRKNDKKVKVQGKKGKYYKIKVYVQYKRKINVSGYSVRHETDFDYITINSDSLLTEGEIKALTYRTVIGIHSEKGYKYNIGVNISSIKVLSVKRYEKLVSHRYYNKKKDTYMDNPNYVRAKKVYDGDEVDY